MSFNRETGLYQGFIYCITNKVNGKKYIGQTRTSVKQRWKGHKSSVKQGKTALYRAMRKYGIENFDITIIYAISDKTISGIKETLNFLEKYFIWKEKTLCTENGYNITRGGDTASVFIEIPVDQYDLQLNFIKSYENSQIAERETNIKASSILCNCEHYQQTAGGYIWCHKGDVPQKPKYKYDYNIDNVDISKYEPKRLIKLMTMGWNGKRVFQYNIYGEVVNIFNDPLEAADIVRFSSKDLYAYLGEHKHFNNTSFLYEGDEFHIEEEFEMIRPISMYDINGNYLMRFQSGKETDDYVGCSDGGVRKSIKNGGTCKGYYFSYYGEKPLMKTKKLEVSVEMLNDDSEIVHTFSCQRDIAKFFNMNDLYKQVRKAIKTKTKYKGFYWRYKDEVTAT